MTLKKLNADEQAREVVQAHFVAMLQSMMQLGLHPSKMLTPWMDQGAALFATVKMHGGGVDARTTADAFVRECDAAVGRVLVNITRVSTLPQ